MGLIKEILFIKHIIKRLKKKLLIQLEKLLTLGTKKPLPNAWTVTRTSTKPNPIRDPDNINVPNIVVNTNLGTFKELKDAKSFIKGSINNRRPQKINKNLLII